MFRVRMCNLSFFSSKYTHMQYFQPVFEYICFYVFYTRDFFTFLFSVLFYINMGYFLSGLCLKSDACLIKTIVNPY